MSLGLGALATTTLQRCMTGLRACGSYAAAVLRAAAFWGTILLPAVIVGVLVTGVVVPAPLYLAVLVGLNVLCIVFGRRYRRE